MVKKITKRYVNDLEARNRGLHKRILTVNKAARNNYNGMHYWKKQALTYEDSLVAIALVAMQANKVDSQNATNTYLNSVDNFTKDTNDK
jgi:hypothetical protein